MNIDPSPVRALVAVTDESFARWSKEAGEPLLLAFCDNDPASRRLRALLTQAAPSPADGVTILVAASRAAPRLMARFGVAGVPAVLWLRAGQVGYQFIGELRRQELNELLSRVVK